MNKIYPFEYKENARYACKKDEKKLYIVYAIIHVINFIAIAVTILYTALNRMYEKNIAMIVFSLMLFIVEPAYMYSKIYISRKIYHRVGIFRIKDFAFGFLHYDRAGLVYLYKKILMFLWYLLLIVPGIIKQISYSMAEYILVDKPKMGIRKAIKESKKMMYGHKIEYAELILSYFGWYLLILITLGLAAIWVGPRLEMAKYLSKSPKNTPTSKVVR